MWIFLEDGFLKLLGIFGREKGNIDDKKLLSYRFAQKWVKTKPPSEISFNIQRKASFVCPAQS